IEVRFRNGQALHHMVFTTLRERLRAENLTARLRPPSLPTAQWSMTNAAKSAVANDSPALPLPFPTKPAPVSPVMAEVDEELPANETQSELPEESLSATANASPPERQPYP